MSFDDYFFVRPSFLRGTARVIDFGGSLQKGSYLISDTAVEADTRAVLSDFGIVDRDMARAARAATSHGKEEAKSRHK